MNSATERSAVYRAFAHGFSYEGAQGGQFGLNGPDYNNAFDPAVNPAASSLREVAYTEQDHSALFEELMRFYSFFGLAREQRAETPDHLSVELEFMHYLTHLEGVAGDDDEQRRSVRRAQHDFLNRHLLRLVGGVRRTLGSDSAACIALVENCHAFIQSEMAAMSEGMHG